MKPLFIFLLLTTIFWKSQAQRPYSEFHYGKTKHYDIMISDAAKGTIAYKQDGKLVVIDTMQTIITLLKMVEDISNQRNKVNNKLEKAMELLQTLISDNPMLIRRNHSTDSIIYIN